MRRATPEGELRPTASGDSPEYVAKFYAAFANLSARPSHLYLTLPNVEDLREYVLDQDAIYVGGGHTVNMLSLWRSLGLDQVLAEACANGTVLSGISAGSVCWFRSGTTDSFGPLQVIHCLDWLPYSNCVHYDSEPGRRPYYLRLVGSGELEPGYAAEDGVALHFVDGALHAAISNRPDGRAFWVEPKDGRATEVQLATRWLRPDNTGHG